MSLVRYISQKVFWPLTLFALSLWGVMGDAVRATIEAWQKEEYSHGWLVPLVTLVLLAGAMKARKIEAQSSWTGFALVTASLVLSFLFTLAGIAGLHSLLLVATLLGFFVLLYGVPASLRLVGPLGFLIFIAPLPKFLYYTLSFNMQMASTSLGVWFLQLLNISVFQEGNVIDLGATKLQVVEACNGLRYLFPLMALGYLVAYMYKASPIKRVVLFLSTVPITILMNGLRLFIIGVTVDRWGLAMAEGFIHDFEGWVVFLGCCGVLFAELALLQKIGRKGTLDLDALSLGALARPQDLPRPAFGRPSFAASIVFVIALSVAAALSLTDVAKITPVPLQRPLAEFPMRLGEWQGQRTVMQPAALAVLGTEDYLLADYTSPAGDVVNLYVLYYPKQDGTSNQAVHNPAVCIPGGGWGIEHTSTQTLKLAPRSPGAPPEALPVNRMVIGKEGVRELVYYWFIQDGQAIASGNLSRLAVIRNAVFKGRTNGSMVRITTLLRNGETEKDGEERLSAFIQGIHASLAFMP